MDFGYDEEGNRTYSSSDSSSAEVEEKEDVMDVRSDGGSSSGFSDDVELIIGEAGTDAPDAPLVEPSASGGRAATGVHRGAAGFLLEARARQDDDDGPTLLLTGPTTAATSMKERGGYMDLLATTGRLRSVALIGCLHHGKTSLLKMLLDGKTYVQRQDEVDRGISVKSHVVSAAVSGGTLCPSNMLCSFMDTPGHPDFIAEAAAALRLADVALLCVDAVEGLLSVGERLIEHAIVREEMPIMLVITKVDRLMLELKLPPADAYRKLRFIVEQVNNAIASCGHAGSTNYLVAPQHGSVCFASAKLGFFFSCETFALKYAAAHAGLHHAALAPKLWGPVCYDGGAFIKISNMMQVPTFIAFVLEPLYKVVAHAMTGNASTTLSDELHPLPRSPLDAATEAVRFFCGNPAHEGVDALLSILPCPTARSAWLTRHYHLNECISAVGSDGDGVVAVATMLRGFNKDEVVAVVRILCGSLRASTRIMAVDEYASEDDPARFITLKTLMMPTVEGGFTSVGVARAGQIIYATGSMSTHRGSHFVLIGGCAAMEESNEEEMGMMMSEDVPAWLHRVRVPTFGCGAPLVHVSLELKEPRMADQLAAALYRLQATTPSLALVCEESGDYTLTGFGELHLDVALHELRTGLCPGAKMGISQPFVSFHETVVEEEGSLAVAGARKAAVGCVCSAMDRPWMEAVEHERIHLFPDTQDERRDLWRTLRNIHHLDPLDAQHIIALGPDPKRGPSVLVDDTLPEESSFTMTDAHRRAIIAGFREALQAGPLTGEVVRGVTVQLILANIEPSMRETLVAANARKAVRHALLGACPRLMEPILAVELVCAADGVEPLAGIFQQRRGAILGEEPIPATPLTRVRALVPAMDSFGLETQLRALTNGQSFPFFSFAQWDLVPGDPFDRSIRVAPLEPAKGHQLARDFVLKARFRKGLPINLLGEL